jgi:C4-dicarboxylate-specific signal transduction histidine kinase
MEMGLSANSAQTDQLGKILEKLEVKAPIKLEVNADQDARSAQVPAAQFHLLIDELVRNAANAVSQKAEPLITITAVVKRRMILRPLLILFVTDNGVGMSSAMLTKAKEPFFSTKAGTHVGLGLTSCIEMVKSMAGRFNIKSVHGLGTVVRVSYALPSRDLGQ